MSKQAKVDVILNSEQAKARLKELQDYLDVIKAKRLKAMEEGNAEAVKLYNTELKKTGTEIDKVQKQWTDVDGVLKNMSGSTVRELKTAYSQMRRELESMSRTDPGYADKAAQVKALKSEIDVASGSMNKHGLTIKGLLSTLGSWAAGLGIATGAMEAVKFVIGATDSLSDKFSETIGGLTAGMSYLSRSIATLDFSNFLTNMGNAIKAGSDYVSTLDKIGDRTRAIGIIESKDRARLAELLIIRRDVTKTDKQRIEAAKEILAIEQNNANRRKSLTSDLLNNELQYASKMSGLSKERISQLLIEQETNRAAIDEANNYNEALEKAKLASNVSQGASMYGQVTPSVLSKEALTALKTASPEVKQLAAELSKLGKLNEEEYERITNAYKNVGEANAYFSETTARTQIGMAKLMKGQLEDNESEVKNYTSSVANEVEKEIGAYAKLNAELSSLEDQFRNLKASNQPVPDSLIHQIISKRGELKDIEDSVKAIGEGMAMLSMKQAGVIIPGTPTQPGSTLNKRNNTIPTGAPEGTEKIFEPGFKNLTPEEKKAFAIDQAKLTNNTIFDIIKNRQQAEFDQKMSMLERQKEAELSNINLTAEQRNAINEKYAKKEAALKTQQYKKDQSAAIFKAIIETAINVVQAFPNPVAMIAAGIVGATQIAVIKSQKPPQYQTGGYTPGSISDETPVGVVHANEFVANADTLKNPVIKSFFDVIDYAQKTGTVNQISIPSVLIQRGYKRGGYVADEAGMEKAEQSFLDKFSSGNPITKKDLRHYGVMEVHQWRILSELSDEVKKLRENGVRGKWNLYDLEKAQTNKQNIESVTEM